MALFSNRKRDKTVVPTAAPGSKNAGLEAQPGTAPLISVIIPVYNSMPYLTELLNSLETQDLAAEKFEVIAVNDGSTDFGDEILDIYAKRNANFRIIHQENSGWPGKPRNVGIDHARGDYVFFCDADDRLGSEALRRMTSYATTHDLDILIPRMVGIGGRRVQQGFFAKTRPEVSLEFVLASLSPQKMIRRQLIEQHQIRFREDKVRLEDGMAMVQAYVAAERISILADYDYYEIRLRSDGQNISVGKIDPAGYVASLSHIARTVRNHTQQDAAYTRRLLAGLFTRKALSFYEGRRFMKYTPEARQAWVDHHRKYLNEFIATDREAVFNPARLVKVELIARGDLAALERLATGEIEAAANPVVEKIRAADSTLEVVLTSPAGAPVPKALLFEDRESKNSVQAELVAADSHTYVAKFAHHALIAQIPRLGNALVHYSEQDRRRITLPEEAGEVVHAGVRVYRTAYGYLSVDTRKAQRG
ncbi:glycosyltransferase family 2 protein [Glutamicibacter sp. AOP38-B1-38]|uniref:glycosyltransferase family 2 protein n=1 Tax=Glutamicibacter sp. AOP38-B1-38 TaxID=3457680 RepID=UPI0040335678